MGRTPHTPQRLPWLVLVHLAFVFTGFSVTRHSCRYAAITVMDTITARLRPTCPKAAGLRMARVCRAICPSDAHISTEAGGQGDILAASIVTLVATPRRR